jgi:hypothetical protein
VTVLDKSYEVHAMHLLALQVPQYTVCLTRLMQAPQCDRLDGANRFTLYFDSKLKTL